MARVSSFVVLSLGLCFATPARAEAPAEIPAVILPATSNQIQQTVDRAIGYVTASGDETQPPDSKSTAERNATKVPTRITGGV